MIYSYTVYVLCICMCVFVTVCAHGNVPVWRVAAANYFSPFSQTCETRVGNWTQSQHWCSFLFGKMAPWFDRWPAGGLVLWHLGHAPASSRPGSMQGSADFSVKHLSDVRWSCWLRGADRQEESSIVVVTVRLLVMMRETATGGMKRTVTSLN